MKRILSTLIPLGVTAIYASVSIFSAPVSKLPMLRGTPIDHIIFTQIMEDNQQAHLTGDSPDLEKGHIEHMEIHSHPTAYVPLLRGTTYHGLRTEPSLGDSKKTDDLNQDTATPTQPIRPLRKLFQFGGGPHITTRNSHTWGTNQKYNSIQYAGKPGSDTNAHALGNAYYFKQHESSFGYGPKLGSRWKNGRGFVWGDRRCRYRCVRNTRWSKEIVDRKKYTGYSHHNSPEKGRNNIQGSTAYRVYKNTRKDLDTPTNPIVTAAKESWEMYTSAYDVDAYPSITRNYGNG